MKIKFVLFIALLSLVGCKTTKDELYSTNALLNHDTQGIITLRGISDEFDENTFQIKNTRDQLSTENSHKRALQHLFYMGFPGTDFKNPIIPKGISVETQHKAYFDEFWKNGYRQFVLENKTTFQNCAEKSRCTKAVSVFKINYNMLRKELERAKVINKIGF